MPRQKALCLDGKHDEEEEDDVKVINEQIKSKNDALVGIIDKLSKIETKLLENKKKDNPKNSAES